MTTCDKCKHGALNGACANPDCSYHMGSYKVILDADGHAQFRNERTPTGLWLWVLDTGKGEA